MSVLMEYVGYTLFLVPYVVAAIDEALWGGGGEMSGLCLLLKVRRG
jgi:hypothetical protein